MPTELNALLADVLITAHRLTRIAAQATGSTTPSAVWHTLSILSTDGPLRIGNLARAARVSQPAMTKLLRHLAGDELVLRIADSNDSRAWLIAIAPKGKAALEDWRVALGRVLGSSFTDLTDDDIQTLERAVTLLKERTKTKRKVA